MIHNQKKKKMIHNRLPTPKKDKIKIQTISSYLKLP